MNLEPSKDGSEVVSYGAGAQVHQSGNFLHRLPFNKASYDFALASRQFVSLSELR